MTLELQKEIVKTLFSKNSKLFFKKLESATESNNAENPFFIEIKGEWDGNSQIIKIYELKDEFKELLPKLSLVEILQIIDNNEIKTIRKWVTFFGIIFIIQIVAGIIAGIIIATS